MVVSQTPVDLWHAMMPDPTIADAALDRLVHNAHRISLTGPSMRKEKGMATDPPQAQDTADASRDSSTGG
jgi:DNA replication protein DnaC